MITVEIKQAKQLEGNYSAFVSFNYDETIVNTIKRLPFRMYDMNAKTWEIPINKVAWLQKELFPRKFNIIDPENKLHEDVDVEIPEGFEFKTKPFEHQLEALKYGLQYDRWFLGDEQGLGKTKQVIDVAVARKIKYEYKHCLIVCGVNTLKWNWVNEIHTHSDEDAYILGQRLSKNGTIKIGSNKDKYSDLQGLYEGSDYPYFIITNVESFRDKDFAELTKKLCDRGIINMCAADEMHKMKNPSSQQSKGFLKCLPKCRIAMTGTPLMNTPLDLYIILRWLGYESHAFYSFKQHYCIMGGFGGYEIVGYKNMAELQAKLSDLMVRRLKEDVFDLPPKVFVDEYIDMTPKQAIIYKEVQCDLKMNIDKIANSVNPLAELIRLRQATGYTGVLSSDIQESAKLDRLEEIVEESVANNRQVVIFSNWTAMTDVIFDKLKSKYVVSIITGDTKDNLRQSHITEFQEGRSKVMIGTIGALGTGVTLTQGTVVIFLDHPWSRALYDQAVDRCHRIGQQNNITIYNLMCKDTIDERIWNIVNQKGLMSDTIVDGKVQSNNKIETLLYLLG